MKTYKFRLYPNNKQVDILQNTLNTCRYIYNTGLEDRINCYNRTGKSLSYYDQANWLKELDNNIYQQIAQDVLRRLDKAYQNFFRRIKQSEIPGFPRFQGYNRYDSFTYPQLGFKIIDNRHVELSKIGTIKFIQHRNIEGKIKTCTIKRYKDKWYINFSCEIPEVEKVEIKNIIGIDLGITTLATLSNGIKIKNPRILNKYINIIKDLQRRLSLKRKGSNNYKKLKSILSKLYEKLVNVRNDNLHKLSRKLVDEYDLIILEDLNIKQMVKSNYLSRSIHDVSWNKLVNFISYKADYAGKIIELINPYNTSKQCSNCGNIKELTLSDRIYKCDKCNFELDRDYNAAINIKNKSKLGANLFLKKEKVSIETAHSYAYSIFFYNLYHN